MRDIIINDDNKRDDISSENGYETTNGLAPGRRVLGHIANFASHDVLSSYI